MKFVHIADLHLDSPFRMLSDRSGLGDVMRIEQRNALKNVIEYIKENKIPMLFISGDLYEQNYVKKSTIEYINNLFKEIPETKIFIAPGNHDPYIKNSYYNEFCLENNVKIFKGGKIEKFEFDNIDIYGFGFDDFYCSKSIVDNLKIENKEKINILVMHGDLDGGNKDEKQYNPISKKTLKEKGFDYCALGHIHKLDYKTEENQNIVYPGSLVSLGFDELGEHGFIVGDIEKENLNLNFVKIEQTEFEEIELNVNKSNSIEELYNEINNLNLEKNKLYKIILIGNRNFEINIYDLFKLNLNEKIIKIKNKTKPNLNLDNLKNETTLKGLFINEMLKKLESTSDLEEREKIEKAIEIGLEVLE